MGQYFVYNSEKDVQVCKCSLDYEAYKIIHLLVVQCTWWLASESWINQL